MWFLGEVMRILFERLFFSYIDRAVEYELEKMGILCTTKTHYTPKDPYRDDALLESLRSDIESLSPDAVFTVNFWPLVARACHSTNCRYISWSYDCPQDLPTLSDMDYDENNIFLFDRWEAADYRARGLERVFHVPLAVSCDLWDEAALESPEHECDISLVGSLYQSTFPGLLGAMEPYDQGFFRGVSDAQRRIYGYYLADELITEDRLRGILDILGTSDMHVAARRLSYSMGTYMTFQDRLTLLSVLSRGYDTVLYSGDVPDDVSGMISDCKVRPWADYHTEMPLIFKNSCISLNPVLRVIRSGIPLRALDVMGCGGFLISAYQPELAELFDAGREVVCYGSMEEAIALCDHYLSHEQERLEIAAAGYEKVKKDFTYADRFARMFEIAGL